MKAHKKHEKNESVMLVDPMWETLIIMLGVILIIWGHQEHFLLPYIGVFTTAFGIWFYYRFMKRYLPYSLDRIREARGH